MFFCLRAAFSETKLWDMGQDYVVVLERDISVVGDIEPTLFLGSFGKTEMYHLAIQQELTPLLSFTSLDFPQFGGE